MDNLADTQYAIHDLLKARWSPRAFSARPVEEDKLAALFEAARWAPSGGNSQPWAFVVVTQGESEAHRRLLGALTGRNPAWAGNVPVLVLAAARVYPESERRNRYAYYDTGQAVAHLTFQAHALGLYVHQMGGFDTNAACAAVGLPDEYVPMTVTAIGYLGSADDLPEDLRAREVAPRTRKPLAEFVFRGRWDHPFVP
jgi:nitroreductase